MTPRACHTNHMPGTPTTAPIVAVVGATASGKTGLSLDLAERLGGEVVNTDAMQVYRGMDVGTAKLPEAERRGIPHHLLDTLTVREPATVAEFQRWARDVIDRLRGRGTTPVLVGGSALYTRAILDRFDFPGTDDGVRRAAGRTSSPSVGAAGSARRADGARPRRGRPDPPRERPPHRPRPRGRRADRPAVQRQPPAPRVRRPAHRPDRRRHRPRDPRRSGSPQRVDAMFAGRLRRGGAAPARPRARRGPHGAARDRLPRGRRPPARRAHRGRGPEQTARPPAGSPAARTRGSARTRASSGSGTTTRSSSTRRSPPSTALSKNGRARRTTAPARL